MNDCSSAGRRSLALLVASTCLLASAFSPWTNAEAAGRAVTSARSRDLADVARSVGRGGAMRVEGVAIEGFADAAGLDLERFEVAAPGARFVAQSAGGPRALALDVPAYFRGSVDGMKASVAVLSVRRSGEIRGIVSGTDGTWVLGRAAGAADGLRSRRVDRAAMAAARRRFACEQLERPEVPRTSAAGSPSATSGTSSGTSSVALQGFQRLPIAYTAQIAVELDYEFFQLSGSDAPAAMLYALDLMAFTGALGESELGMNVQVPFLQVWTIDSDPFSSGDLSRLGQLRSRWNQAGSSNCGGADCTTLDRTTVILMSGAGSGGVAYVPGICDSWHSPTGGYSYAFAGAMDGNFHLDSPSVVWDVVVATHELGHNFGSPHTHCYNPPVDECYSGEMGCYSGPTSLPSGCPGSGQGCATIMGYCHLLSGGLGNVSLTYGAGHPYGDAPDRVPDEMMARLAVEYLSAPGCLAPTGGMFELDVTTGGTGSGTVTSSPAGIDCGATCATYFDADTEVTLTATPGTFSQFTGWSGDPDCSDGVVTLSAAASCVATFDGSCGAGNEDCDDGNPCTIDTCPADDHCENAGAPLPSVSCLVSPRTKLKISNSDDPNRDKLQWQWLKGAAVVQADLGDPASTTDYALCIYDSTGGVSSLATSLALPAGSAGWRNLDPGGWKWIDRSGQHDGLTRFEMRTGVLGKSRVKLKAAGVSLPLPTPVSMSELLDADTEVVVQLLSSEGTCWTSTFDAGAIGRNTTTTFNASGN